GCRRAGFGATDADALGRVDRGFAFPIDLEALPGVLERREVRYDGMGLRVDHRAGVADEHVLAVVGVLHPALPFAVSCARRLAALHAFDFDFRYFRLLGAAVGTPRVPG